MSPDRVPARLLQAALLAIISVLALSACRPQELPRCTLPPIAAATRTRVAACVLPLLPDTNLLPQGA
jgi:hypothetical protein